MKTKKLIFPIFLFSPLVFSMNDSGINPEFLKKVLEGHEKEKKERFGKKSDAESEKKCPLKKLLRCFKETGGS